jgi:hypothetical protein
MRAKIKPTKEFIAVVRGIIWGICMLIMFFPILFVSALFYFPTLGHSWKLWNWFADDFRELMLFD